MIPPVRGWTGPDWTSPGLVQSSPTCFWTGIGPVPSSVGPGLDWSGLAWTSPALCPGLGYISHCISLLMGEIDLDGTEYTDRTVILSPGAGIQRWEVIKCEDESCFRWYLAMKRCRIGKCVWTGPDWARPVQDWQSVVQFSATFDLDWTGLSPTRDWDRPDWWNHCRWRSIDAHFVDGATSMSRAVSHRKPAYYLSLNLCDDATLWLPKRSN